MTREPAKRSTVAVAVALVTLFTSLGEVAVRYAENTWTRRDGRFYTNVAVTLTENLSVDQSAFCRSWYEDDLGWNRNLDASWSNVAMGAHSERLPKHPILLPLLATPLFWAFGLHGTLLFNLLMIALAGGAAFSIGRRYGSAAAAASVAVALILATGIRELIYNFHVDILMFALFASGLAMVHKKRGLLAGVLIGMTVVLRPTALLWLPSLAIIALAEGDRRTLLRALMGGAIPLVLFAIANQILYGAPHWSGYNRVIIRVAGETQIADVSDAFSIPLEQGLEQLWEGRYGVRTKLTLIAAAAPGLVLLMRRHFFTSLAAAGGTALSIVIFAQYRWYGDRFLWPSCVLLIPALTQCFDVLAIGLRKRAHWRAPLVAAFAAVAIVAARAAAGGPLERRGIDFGLDDLGLHLAILAVFAMGLTRAADRLVPGPLAALAPVTLLVMPGVADRVIAGGIDLQVAAVFVIALGARRWYFGLPFALLGAYLIISNDALADPAVLLEAPTAATNRPITAMLVLTWFSIAWLGRRALWLTPVALVALAPVAGLSEGEWPLFALALLAISVPWFAQQIAGWASQISRALKRPHRYAMVLAIFVGLFAAGAVERSVERPFRIASYESMRTATVHLGDRPCDMMAWEHMNWECAQHDRSPHGQTGLASSAPLHVGGEELGMFLISVRVGRPRIVRWEAIEATPSFELKYAVPDELEGGGRLLVLIDGVQREIVDLPASPDWRLHTLEIDTSELAGRTVPLELQLVGRGTVVVDGGFVSPPG